MAKKKQKITGVAVVLVTLLGGAWGNQAWAADPRNGAKLYSTHCSSCHGPRGTGNMPGMPNFLRGEGLFKSDAALVQMLETGRGIMPAFRGLMTTQELLDVVAYLRTLH